jgi:hypothetical protein
VIGPCRFVGGNVWPKTADDTQEFRSPGGCRRRGGEMILRSGVRSRRSCCEDFSSQDRHLQRLGAADLQVAEDRRRRCSGGAATTRNRQKRRRPRAVA